MEEEETVFKKVNSGYIKFVDFFMNLQFTKCSAENLIPWKPPQKNLLQYIIETKLNEKI